MRRIFFFNIIIIITVTCLVVRNCWYLNTAICRLYVLIFSASYWKNNEKIQNKRLKSRTDGYFIFYFLASQHIRSQPYGSNASL